MDLRYHLYKDIYKQKLMGNTDQLGYLKSEDTFFCSKARAQLFSEFGTNGVPQGLGRSVHFNPRRGSNMFKPYDKAHSHANGIAESFRLGFSKM